MICFPLESLDGGDLVVVQILNQPDGKLLLQTVGKVNKSPNAFDVIKCDIVDEIGLSCNVECREMVESLALPDCKSAIPEADVSRLLILCHSSHNIPRRILTRK